MTYLSAIIFYLFALVAVGIFKVSSVKDSEDFMVAGRTLPWYILVGTLLATWMGSGSLFSGAGLGYRNGLAGLWSSAGAWLGIALIYFITKRIRNFGKVTVPDIFEARYGKLAAILATITTVKLIRQLFRINSEVEVRCCPWFQMVWYLLRLE